MSRDALGAGRGDRSTRGSRTARATSARVLYIFCIGLAIASSGRFVLAGMGQEPLWGRWASDAGAKNGLLLHRLKLED